MLLGTTAVALAAFNNSFTCTGGEHIEIRFYDFNNGGTQLNAKCFDPSTNGTWNFASGDINKANSWNVITDGPGYHYCWAGYTLDNGAGTKIVARSVTNGGEEVISMSSPNALNSVKWSTNSGCDYGNVD